jgi:hypothetical protein
MTAFVCGPDCQSGIRELSGHPYHCPNCNEHLTSLGLCPKCGIRFVECPTCGGNQFVLALSIPVSAKLSIAPGLGMTADHLVMEKPCPDCDGAGVVSEDCIEVRAEEDPGYDYEQDSAGALANG